MTVQLRPPGTRTLRYVAPGVALLLVLSAGALAAVETEDVHSYWDGLWWSLSLVSTVGFAGATPTTALGKLISAALMVLGFVLLATTTAAIASLFVREDELPEDTRELGFEQRVLDALRDLEARLAAIEGALADPTIEASMPTPRSSGRSMLAPPPRRQGRSDQRHFKPTPSEGEA